MNDMNNRKTGQTILLSAVMRAAGIWILAAMPQAPAMAQPPSASPFPEQTITIEVGKSVVVTRPGPVKRVSVTDPKIADVKVLTADQVMLLGKSAGTTDLMVWNDKEELWQTKVTVRADMEHVRAELQRLFPRANLGVSVANDVAVITGLLEQAEQSAQLRKFMDLTKLKYEDATRIAGLHQVQIQVRVAEVSRTAIRALGVNGFITGSDAFGGVTVGPDGGTAINPFSIGAPLGASAATSNVPFQFLQDTGVSPSVTVFGGFPKIGLELFLSALAENQYLRVLAEPTLVAISGEEASFLAGGEFPIPVVQSGVTGGGTAITIEYKEFGVRLKFRPTVLGNNKIRLAVAPEVSELTDIGAVVIQGFRVPALNTRKAQTTLELSSGQTFGMAGLIQRTVNARNSRVPGVGDVPVLGALFRSVRYASGETELAVLVTATVVEPMSPRCPPPLPGVTHNTPNDWQLYGLGQIEGDPPLKLTPSQKAWLRETGLTRLEGPGGWSGEGTRPATMRRIAPASPATCPAPGGQGNGAK